MIDNKKIEKMLKGAELLASLKEFVEITSRKNILSPFEVFYEELDGKIEKAKELIKKYEDERI